MRDDLSLETLEGFKYYFAATFTCNLTYYEIETFSYSSLHRIFQSENFRFPFFSKNSLTCEVKVQKIVANLLDKLRKLNMNETVS